MSKIEEIELRTQLEQVTEECGELTKACMKLIRALGNGNPCDISKEEALENVVEEMSDVGVALDFLVDKISQEFGIDADDIWQKIGDIGVEKTERWERRLADAEQSGSGGSAAVDGCCDSDSCSIEGF